MRDVIATSDDDFVAVFNRFLDENPGICDYVICPIGGANTPTRGIDSETRCAFYLWYATYILCEKPQYIAALIEASQATAPLVNLPPFLKVIMDGLMSVTVRDEVDGARISPALPEAFW